IVAFGGLGAMVATAPTEALVSIVGWRYGFVALAIATFVVAVMIWFVAPERVRAGAGEPIAGRIRGMFSIYRSGVFWRVAPLAALSQGGFLAIQTLWAGPWLRDIAGLDSRTVSFTLLAGAAGFVIGNLVVGFAAERLARRNIQPLVTAAVGMGLFILVQALVLLEWTSAPALLWFAFGATGTAGVVVFSVLALAFPPELAGRASTAQNLLIFAAAFALQWGMGEIINLWPVGADGAYSVMGYRAAFGIALALQVAAFVWMLLRRPGMVAR
ncbi:MAG: MFS transporter, partial [Alphaproteobacteria bacterium]